MSSSRLLWLIDEVHKGRSASVSFSYNAVTCREKLKFVLEDAYSCTNVYRPCILAALTSLHAAVLTSIVTDKGHKSHTNGNTIVEFWIQQPPMESTFTENRRDSFGTQLVSPETPPGIHTPDSIGAVSQGTALTMSADQQAVDVDLSLLPMFDDLRNELEEMRQKLENQNAANPMRSVFDLADRLANEVRDVHGLILQLPFDQWPAKRKGFLDHSSVLIGQIRHIVSQLPEALQSHDDVDLLRIMKARLETVIEKRDELIEDIKMFAQTRGHSSGSSSAEEPKPFKPHKSVCDNPQRKKSRKK